MKIFKSTAVIAVVVIFFSCKNDQTPTKSEDNNSIAEFQNESKAINADNEFYSDTIASPQIIQSKEQQPQVKEDWDKKIIKTASLNLEIKDYGAYYSSLKEKARNLGGYIAQEEQNQSDYKIENNITIKVPVDQFDKAIEQFTSNIETLNEKKISSADVTAEFIDTKSRMEAKKQVRQRYIDLLKQARNMEEILNVQSEINNIQEQIESGLGRIEFLSHSSSFSTINLTYYQILNSSAKNNDKPSFSTRLSSAFKSGWAWIGELFVGIVAVWPLFFLVFITFLLYKRFKKAKPKQA